MSNLQDLMSAVIHAPRTIPAYSLRVMPVGSNIELFGTIRTRRSAAEVRALVASMGRRRWPRGFTFAVRPL